jgi:5-methylcytosine-specific restriction protein A
MPYIPPSHRPPRVQLPEGRPHSAARGYDWTWRKLRVSILARKPVCQMCHREAAAEVDHIIPIRQGGNNDESNLQALCKACHSRKTATEDGAFGRKTKERRG